MRTDVRSDSKGPQEYLLALCAIQGVTSHAVARQAQQPGGLEALVRGDLAGNSRYETEMRRALRAALQGGLQAELDRAREEIDSAQAIGARLITVLDDGYPANLRLIYNLPPFLFIRGTLSRNDALAVAVVGTRDASADGLAEARRIAGELAKAGVTVVSSLSTGVDTAVHEAVLEHGGRSIAVLSSGIIQCYPPENVPLAERIASTGAVVSRYWPSQTATRYTFTNGCVVSSGIAQATLVVEAPCPSIAQGQARQALEHGKQVLLLSRLVETEPWAREYLKHGAIEVQTAEDVLRRMEPVARIEELAAAREFKKRVRIPYYNPAPISWGATSQTGSSEPAWPGGDSSNQTPSSAWPSGGAAEDETKEIGDGLSAALQALHIEGSMYGYAEQELPADPAGGGSSGFSFDSGPRSSQAGSADTDAEVELIFDPQYEGGYTVYAPELPGLVAKGETLEQATASATEALALYAKSMREHGRPVRHNVLRRTFRIPS